MLAVNLSLFLFNLVPISGLDGSHLLQAIFGILRERDVSEAHDLEALERGGIGDDSRSRHGFKVEFLQRVISGGAAILFGLDLGLVVLGLIRT
jgi:membrane-associated protease RseP (regulator of RpoE activity)